MSEPRYDIFFKGESISEALNREVLQQRFAKAFKLEASKAAPFFSGRAIALKKNQTRADTLKFKKALEGLGAKVYIRNAGIGFAADSAPCENTAQQTRPNNDSSVVADKDNSPKLSVSEVGGELLNSSEKKQAIERKLDLSHIQLSDKDSLEDLIETKVRVDLPSLDHLTTAEPGVSILEGYETVNIPLPIGDTSHLSLDPLGEALLKAHERKKDDISVPDTTHISLSEDESSLPNAAKKNSSIQAPDVSHLSLTD